ncbi:SUKH-4 family immunity protein [Streptomyces sp. A1-5]|uniref:SUKH-4 family immunity protein n=1 Tax=Streptomyces sp. A1-5 TaxID=2738410 RepID=UPI001F1F54C6|nr:SUKH-4 family immunity protein [Streptomyces sp. A1-5]UJB42392.1 SUKH-4 family immunity protein [Streptomyces sp. A1-5]
MVTFAQAQERAEQWVNGEAPSEFHREVRVREFALGFVAWAEDREGGPAGEGGRSRLVIARDSGETTLWPGLPVGEVIRRFEEEYGAPTDGGYGAAEPPQRIDLEATSFLLTPPEWLQEAADAMGLGGRKGTDGRGGSAGDSAAGPAAGPAAGSAGDPAAGPAPVGADPAPVSAAGSGAADDTPWAAADTTAGGAGEDRSVAPPQTVFAPPLAGSDDEDTPATPRVRPDAKTELLQGGSQLPRTRISPALPPPVADVPGQSGAGGPVGLPPMPPAPPVMPPAPPAAPPAAPAPAAASAGLRDLPPPTGVPIADVPPPPGVVPPAPPSGGGPGGGGHAAATMLAGGPSLPGNAGGPPPPPGAPGIPGAGRDGGRPDPESVAAVDGGPSRAVEATGEQKADARPGDGPAPTGPGASGTPAGGYVPTQLVSQLDASELDLSAVDGPSGGPGGAAGAQQPGGGPGGPGAAGGVHAAATMFADGAALQAAAPGPGGAVGGPGGPGAPGGPGLPPPPPPGPLGAPKPPGAPGKPGAPAGGHGPGGQDGPPPPPPPAPPGGAGATGGVHAAATMLAGGAALPGGPGMPPAAGPGMPPAPPMAPPAQPGPPPGPPGVPAPGVPGPGGPGAPGAYGYPQAPSGQPTVGPGYMAVLSYRAPDGSEQKIVRRSAPGTPHPEWQLLHELRAMNVPPQQVVELHTELECCELPGGYCARMVRETWPQVRISHTAAYGRDHASRQQGVRHLIEHQGELHQVADGPARPAPVRAPLPHPSQVQPVPPVPPQAIGQELEQAFGPQGIFRFDQRAVSRQGVPDVVAQTLVWAGLPVDFGPFFWAQAQPGRPVPTLAELAAERRVQPAPDAGSYLVMGNDFGRQLCVQYGTANIVAVPLEAGPGGQAVAPQFVNTGLPEFVRCLAMLGRMWRLRYGLTPEQAGRWTVDFQAQLVALDPPALGSPETWWSVLLEQMWDGLL